MSPQLRALVQTTFGQVVMAMAALPRYLAQTLGDLQALVLEPLLRDRIAIASAKPVDGDGDPSTVAGIAIWASLSDEAEERLRTQIAERVFPVRLKPEDWASGDKVWLLDVIAPTRPLASAVLANLRQVIGRDEMSIHPIAAAQVDKGLLERMRAPQPATDGLN